MAGVYVFLEAEFLAVSQVLVYVGAIAMLIAFAIMLTRSMMYGRTFAAQQSVGQVIPVRSALFRRAACFARATPWPTAGEPVVADEALIGALGREFVTTYVIAFEVLGLLLLLALVGAVMLARDK